MAARTVLTEKGIQAARERSRKAGRVVWVADGFVPRTAGGLQLYIHPRGVPRWYWRYSKADGKTARIMLGRYTAKPAVGSLTLPQARERVMEKAALYRAPESRDVRVHIVREAERIASEKAAVEQAHLAAQLIKEAASKYTLEKFLACYIAHLKSQDKQSTRNAENLFANHCIKAFPNLAATAANLITARDVVTMLRTLIEAGKGRTAAKLRSYLAAAYALGAKAALEADAPAAFLPFHVESNPARATGALSKFSRALERTLNERELRAYWTALKDAAESPSRDALLLGLLLGGQRPTQLVRATVADVDTHAQVLRLHDPKGKRKQPRVHMLPLTDAAMIVVKRCLARAEKQESTWLFSTHGATHLRLETVSQLSNVIAGALQVKPKAERVVHTPFQLRDIRRTCETELARMGISKDTRAQVLSHGISGIQALHYDKHTYMPEKTAALAAWSAHLESTSADNVVQFRGAAA